MIVRKEKYRGYDYFKDIKKVGGVEDSPVKLKRISGYGNIIVTYKGKQVGSGWDGSYFDLAKINWRKLIQDV